MLSRRHISQKNYHACRLFCLLLLLSFALFFLTARTALASPPSGDLWQQLRQRCENAWLNHAEEIDLEDLQIPLDEQELLHELLSDCPQYGWFVKSHVIYYNTETKLITKAVPSYIYSQKQTQAMQKQLDRALAEMLVDITPDMEPALKALLLHDRLVERCAYDHAAAKTPAHFPDSYTAYGALVRGRAVCEGYAGAYILLLREAGIPAVRMVSEEVLHAWTAIEIAGSFYHVDPTFDDPTGEVSLGLVSHEYFLLNDAELLADGKHGTDFERVAPNPLPEDALFTRGIANASTYFHAGCRYYIDESGALLCHDSVTGSVTELHRLEKDKCIVPVDSSRYASYEWDPSRFAFMAHDDNGIYYNDARHIWRLSPESHDAEIVHTEPDDHMIVGLAFQGGLLRAEIFDATASYYSEENYRRIIATDIEQVLTIHEPDLPASATDDDETQSAEEPEPADGDESESGDGSEDGSGAGSEDDSGFVRRLWSSLKARFHRAQVPLPLAAAALVAILLLRRPGRRRRG